MLGKRLGCLGDQMPPECKHFVDSIQDFTLVTSEMLFGLPFHKIWRTKKWKRLVSSLDDSYTFAKGYVDQKMKEIEELDKNSAGDHDHQAELGMDFLTYMIYSGNMSLADIAVNAIDLLGAGVDTVSRINHDSLFKNIQWNFR